MDPTAVNWNVTIDDFDSNLDYEDQGAWTTPDPSATNFVRSDKPWLRGTYHHTTRNTAVTLKFTGPTLFIYGGVGPTFGEYEIALDSFTQRYSAKRDGYENSTLLFSATNLTYANHALTIRNVGPTAFSLDFIQTTVQLGPPGSQVTNRTYDERDPALTYTGTWGHNEGPLFIGGGTTYTQGDGASFRLAFNGSSILVLGDKKNDHRTYGVTLDGNPEEVYNGTSGCGGAFGLTCEQQYPTIKYFASNLNSSEHVLVLKNYPGVNQSFFDLDSIVVTVPSQYGPRELATGSSPFVRDSGSGSNTTTTSGSKPSSSTGGQPPNPNQTGAADPTRSIPGSLLLFVLLFHLVWTLRRR